MTHSHIKSKTRARAQELRHGMTPPEHKLWQHLKALKSQGYHFRRQTPIGPYIADFVWLSARLIVELDGDSHSSSEALRHDAQRTEFLTAQGFTVLRFANQDVSHDVEGVIETIIAAIICPHP